MNDTDLIKDWKINKNLASYRELKRRHVGMVMQTVNKYRAASIPDASLEAEAWRLFDDAVTSYKDNKGAQFITHLGFQLRKLDRHTKKYQNVARIPENISSQIGNYDRAYSDLEDSMGRRPTNKEISKKMGWSVSNVKRLEKMRRQDLFEGGFEEKGGADISRSEIDSESIMLELSQELTDQEREIFFHLTGIAGKKKLGKAALAKKMKISQGRLSQITGSIAKKLKPYLSKVYGVGVVDV